MKYQLIIFDWDGTLMDSAGRIASAMQAAAVICQQPAPSIAEVKNVIGLSLDIAVEVLFPQLPLSVRESIYHHYKEQYRHCDKTPSPMFAGATELLVNLKQSGYKLAVATGKSRAGLQRVWDISETAHLFDTARCSDEAQSKPSPDMLLQILEHLQLAPEQALMIGDTEYDLAMAKAINMDRIGVSFGAHEAERLQSLAPLVIVDSLAEIRAWV